MDARKVSEYRDRDIFFDPLRHRFYVWDNGKKVYRITKDEIVKYINNN